MSPVAEHFLPVEKKKTLVQNKISPVAEKKMRSQKEFTQGQRKIMQ